MQSPKARTTAAIAVAALLTAASALAAKADSRSQPFSYDPLCPWGRLSDGKGYVVRCLTEKESRTLQEAPSSETPEKAAVEPAAFDVVLGPVRADKGEFPKAVASLDKGMPKYRACIERHGGIGDATGTVEVRFLVRGRGRAEGAVAKKHRGLSQEAAKCIADVVDRRFVGYPDEEMVGATLVVTVQKR